jgi:putative phosphoribosyl transferase
MRGTYEQPQLFRDRADAGRRLARSLLGALVEGGALADLRTLGAPADPSSAVEPGGDGRPPEGIVVLGLPRGGVAVAAEVASALACPLDVIVVRKLGVPYQPELAMGAIGEGGARVLHRGVVEQAGITPAELERAEAVARAELEARVRRLRAGRPHLSLEHRLAVLVDDGIATGSTARAACSVARALGAARVVLAVPVAPAASVAALRQVADEVVCPYMPTAFVAVGQWYEDFSPVSDDDVVALLAAGQVPS